MNRLIVWGGGLLIATGLSGASAGAQDGPRASGAQAPVAATRADQIAREQRDKAAQLRPPVPNKAERYLNYAELQLQNGLRWHPFFESAYSGGGFTLGAGYRGFVGVHNTLDVRGSITASAYKRIEAEFVAPRLFNRRGTLSILGGWREATEVGYYGLGPSSAVDDRANYGFQQPYGQSTLTVRPLPLLVLRGGIELSQWEQTPGSGESPSVDVVYTPATLTGLGASVSYLHVQGTVAIDTRPSAGYARRGGSYGVTFHDFADWQNEYGFTQVDYDAVQHVPLVREAWVLSFHAAVSTTALKDAQQIPFFMLPSVGGGSSLRGYSSWRFRDRHRLLLQAEWRVIANRFLDVGVFYDTGKVAAQTSDLDLDDLKHDYGIGIRFHGPLATPLRVDFAHGDEGLSIVFAASAPF